MFLAFESCQPLDLSASGRSRPSVCPALCQLPFSAPLSLWKFLAFESSQPLDLSASGRSRPSAVTCKRQGSNIDIRLKTGHERRAWLLLGWVTAERSCPCKQPACSAIGSGSEVTFKPL
ncbi:hypothetical protein J6590_103488, partial [Homalodisca vitripennis]